MLLYQQTGKPVPQWFPNTWKLIRTRLTPAEFQTVIDGITTLMIGTHDRYAVPGFKAEADWTNLPWQILWSKASKQKPGGESDYELAAKMMGLMAAEAFKRHPDTWYTDRTTYAGHETTNRYYFKPSVCRERS